MDDIARAVRGASWIDGARNDLRHARRTIARMPLLAAVVIASLGVGIGVNTAIFSWIEAMVLRPLPGVADAASFYLVEPRAESGSFPGASWLEARDLRRRLGSLRDLVAFRWIPFDVGEAPQTERAFGMLVSGNYFSALGLEPARGRFLRPEEAERPGGEPVVVVSHDFWRTRLAADEAVVGRTLRVNDTDLTIIGVAPRGFQGTALMVSFDLWVPATMAPVLLAGSRELEDRGQRGYTLMGRLREPATRATAQGELDAAMSELARLFPATNAGMRGEMRPFWRSPRGPQEMMLASLVVLQAIMLLLLLVVCGNTANLLLARAGGRQREIGVRQALGAGRGRIVMLLMTEALLLALLGVALGVAIAVWGSQALRAVPLTGAFPIRFETGIHGASLAFAALVGVACGLAFGAAPALQLARLGPQRALRAGSGPTARGGLRNVLMAAEVGLALVVLVVAGMFLESFRQTRTDPGFRREGVLLAAYDRSGRGVADADSRAFAGELLDRLRALPVVRAAAIASSVPLDIHGMPLRSFALEGRARDDGAPDRALDNTVTPGYFETMGIPLRAGADFAPLDDTTTAPQAIVNEAFVARYLEGAEPIGRRLEAGGRSYVIAAVARDSLYESFAEPPTPIIYFSYRDRPRAAGEIHVQTRPGAETPLAAEVRRIVRDIDPALPVYDVRTLAEHVEKNLFLRSIPARMFAVLGPLLLALAAIGIYAVVDYAVSHRTAEIGVRLALGATRGDIVRQIVTETLMTAGFGALIGWLIAFVITRLPMLRSDYDPVLYGVLGILMAVAAIASWVPARRASRVDPIVALRSD